MPSLEVRAESADSPLPDLAIRRINCAGGWVNLKNELPSALPLLVWFYAPHWPTCRAEAPDVEQFARQHADEVRVIGLGTQDSGGEAADFVQNYETYSFPVYWDETFESWTAFGIASQPAAVLIAPDGEPLGGWLGRFPEEEVLQLAAAAWDTDRTPVLRCRVVSLGRLVARSLPSSPVTPASGSASGGA